VGGRHAEGEDAVSFEFTHDGHTYRLDTDGGEVHCDQVDEQPAPQQQGLEPSEEVVHG
jgi:hypothetical protein